MTNDFRTRCSEIIKQDSNEKLLQRFLWYVNNFNPIDDERCEGYELIKAEMLRRMEVGTRNENEEVRVAVSVLEKKAEYLSKLFGRTVTVEDIVDCLDKENV